METYVLGTHYKYLSEALLIIYMFSGRTKKNTFFQKFLFWLVERKKKKLEMCSKDTDGHTRKI